MAALDALLPHIGTRITVEHSICDNCDEGRQTWMRRRQEACWNIWCAHLCNDVTAETVEAIAQHLLLLSNSAVAKSTATSLTYLFLDLSRLPTPVPASLDACVLEYFGLHPPLLCGLRSHSGTDAGPGVQMCGVAVPRGQVVWWSARQASTGAVELEAPR
jgi:hypothetical protein